jgi:hypothetical protein
LIVLAAKDRNHDPCGPALDTIAVNGNQLGPAECPGKANQEHCPVKDILGGIAQG